MQLLNTVRCGFGNCDVSGKTTESLKAIKQRKPFIAKSICFLPAHNCYP